MFSLLPSLFLQSHLKVFRLRREFTQIMLILLPFGFPSFESATSVQSDPTQVSIFSQRFPPNSTEQSSKSIRFQFHNPRFASRNSHEQLFIAWIPNALDAILFRQQPPSLVNELRVARVSPLIQIWCHLSYVISLAASENPANSARASCLSVIRDCLNPNKS